MQITFISFGTRGDVQPALALAKTLAQRGHGVRMVASSNFAAWIESHGVTAVQSSVNIQAIMNSEMGQDWIENGHNPFLQARVMRQLYNQSSWQIALDAWDGCQESDLVISSLTSDVIATSIVEKLGVHHISIAMQPALLATRNGPALLYSAHAERDSTLNYWFSKLFMERGMWMMVGKNANRLRKERLGLPTQSFDQYRQRFFSNPILHGYSRHVLPPPSDWPPNLHTVGYWFLDESTGWQPPASLLHFLDAGAPPVYIGFGSMTGRNPQAFTRLLIEAVQRSGQRAILLSGWGGIGDSTLPDSIYRIDAAPHDWLFPRMAATVHHGGAGTTAATLRAGVPTVIVPHIAEQPLWGRRIAHLGVGPTAIPRRKLTVENLAAAIDQAATNTEMKRRVVDLSRKISQEDGISEAVRIIEAATRTK